MAPGDDRSVLFKVAGQPGVTPQIDETAVIGERIDDTLTAPDNFTRLNIPSCDHGKFPVRLHVKRIEVSDKCLVCPSGHANPDPTACLFQSCLLYTSDAADDLLCVEHGGRRLIKKKTTKN